MTRHDVLSWQELIKKKAWSFCTNLNIICREKLARDLHYSQLITGTGSTIIITSDSLVIGHHSWSFLPIWCLFLSHKRRKEKWSKRRKESKLVVRFKWWFSPIIIINMSITLKFIAIKTTVPTSITPNKLEKNENERS